MAKNFFDRVNRNTGNFILGLRQIIYPVLNPEVYGTSFQGTNSLKLKENSILRK